MGISDDIRPRKSSHPHFSPSIGKTESQSKRDHEVDSYFEDNTKKEALLPNNSTDSLDLLEDDFFKSSTPKEDEKPVLENKVDAEKDTVRTASQKAKTIFWAVLFITAICIAAYQNFVPSKNNKSATTNNSSSYYSGEMVTQDNSAVAENSATNTPAAVETPTINAPVTLDKSALSVKVLNGNGISGSAASVRKLLVAAGYTVSSVTNASKFSYAETYIYFKTGQDATASDIKTVLTSRDIILQQADDIVGSYDIVVIVGKK